MNSKLALNINIEVLAGWASTSCVAVSGCSRDSKGTSSELPRIQLILSGKISCIRGSSEIPFLSLGRSQTRRDHGASGAAAEEGRGL